MDPSRRQTRHPDLALVEAVRGGDESAVEEFLARMRCVRRILRAKNRRVGVPVPEHLLEDLIQQTLLAIWSRLDRYEGRGALEAWVYRFCVLVLWDASRKERQRPAATPNPQLDAEHARSPALRRFDECERAYRELERIGPPQNDVIRLKLLEGLSFAEIAGRLELPIGSVKTLYYRGLARVQRGLGAAVKTSKAGGST